MGTAKPWGQSKAIHGGIIATVSAVLGICSIDVPQESVSEIVIGVMGVIGAVLAIIGRVKATKPIRS